ncbi:peptidase domain-containing ABC transporter [Mesorhizobium sp. NPDC059025]|uniref:peptidase domain-containing ABC transporter n=1 Tax=unclassified Mesorhizobium TaxID=325217 RepID=UPI00368D6EF9
MVASIVVRLLGLVQPFVFQTIIDRVLPFQREATLVLVVAVLVGTAVFSVGLDALAAYLGNHMANRLTNELADRVFRHVLNLPLRVLEGWQVGETISRISEIETVRRALTGTVATIVIDALFAVVYIAALLSISPTLTLIVVIVLPLQVLVFSGIGPFIRQRMQDSFLAGSRHQSRMVEAFGNPTTIKAYAAEQIQAGRFQETMDDSLASDFRVVKLNIANHLVVDLLSNMSVILVIFFGSRLVFSHQITLGELVAFHLLADKVSGPIFSLSRTWEHWQGLKIARLRLGDFLNVTSETGVVKPKLVAPERPPLRVTDLSFGYTPHQPVLHGINLVIDPERPTVIVGRSGCGKSTLAKLLCGLYTPDRGRIEIANRNLVDCDPHSVRQAVVYHPQEAVLYSGTALDNLRLINPYTSQSQIDQALADSASDLFVNNLPGGLETDVGERGSFLSGGQRQRLALARTFLTDSKVFVLDEPTSAIDDEAAGKIVKALLRLAKEKTLIVITHNPKLLGPDVNLIDLGQPAYSPTGQYTDK